MWILSHAFAALLIVGFVWAGFWQLGRLDERRAANFLIESRALVSPSVFGDVSVEPDLFDFVAVSVSGHFIDGEVVRVANRSQDGRGGDWIVATFEASSGQILAVNRGFLLRSEETAPVPAGEVELSGWLRRTRTKGWIGAQDSGVGERVPRLNIEDIESRLGVQLVPGWLQLSEIDGQDPSLANGVNESDPGVVTPRPVALDDLDEGSHFSYAMQWFAFAALSASVYVLLLRKLAKGSVER